MTLEIGLGAWPNKISLDGLRLVLANKGARPILIAQFHRLRLFQDRRWASWAGPVRWDCPSL